MNCQWLENLFFGAAGGRFGPLLLASRNLGGSDEFSDHVSCRLLSWVPSPTGTKKASVATSMDGWSLGMKQEKFQCILPTDLVQFHMFGIQVDPGTP